MRVTDRIGRVDQPGAGESTVARLGGDEFTLLLEDIIADSDALQVADRIHKTLAEPLLLESGSEICASASIGIACSRPEQKTAVDVLQDADIAMYRAKAAGKRRSAMFDQQLHEQAITRLQLETDLRRAVERREFCLAYQPIVRLDTGATLGFEALLRRRHPLRGLLQPADFLAIAESGGAIVEVGAWGVRRGVPPAARVAGALRPAGAVDGGEHLTEAVRAKGSRLGGGWRPGGNRRARRSPEPRDHRERGHGRAGPFCCTSSRPSAHSASSSPWTTSAYDPHEPYRPPQPFRDLFADRPYDGEVAFADTVVASIMDRLDKLGLLQSTLIAIVGDHGESLGDHGEETHSMFLYDPALRVPMILWRPGRLPAGKVVRPLVRVVDLAPTLLDLIDAPPLAGVDGRSLLPLVNDRELPAAPAYAETFLPLFYMNWSPLRAIEDARWKYIDAPRPELYDLDRDPREQDNVAAKDPARTAALRKQLNDLAGDGAGPLSAARVDRETLDKLATLGYVAAAVEPQAPSDGGARADPKDMISVFNRLRTANAAVRDGRFAEAIAAARAVLAQDPKNAFALIIVASAQMNQGAYREAIEGYRAYLNLVPTSAYAHHWIAICYVRVGDRDRALLEEEAALAIDPNYADARVLRGGVLAARGEFAAAIDELRKAVATDPDKATLRLDLAKVLVDADRLDDADGEYRRALELDPANADVHTGYGVLLARQQRYDEAIREFRAALGIDPLHDEARFDLAKTLEQQGKSGEARAEYERVAASEQAGPVRSAARERLAALRTTGR